MKQPNQLVTFQTVIDILGGEDKPGEAYNAALNGVVVRKVGNSPDEFGVEVRFTLNGYFGNTSGSTFPEISVSWPSIGSVHVVKAFMVAETMQMAAALAAQIKLTFGGIEFDEKQVRRERDAMSEAARDAREALAADDRTHENIIKGALERLGW